MHGEHEHQVPIWFFIGAILTVYGLLILGYGVFGPPAEERTTALAHLHVDIWWGALLVIVGLFYAIRFRPTKT